MARADAAAESAASRPPARGPEPQSLRGPRVTRGLVLVNTGNGKGALRARLPQQHVIITGRNAPSALVQYADLVTEMNLVKHPYDAGIKAQPGIEF